MAEIDGGDRKAREEMAEIDGGDRKAGEEMAGIDGGDRKARESECLFVWDDASNLYFHSSSGFYHDPNAGWYYISRDGLYYIFENGTYVPLTFDKALKNNLLATGLKIIVHHQNGHSNLEAVASLQSFEKQSQDTFEGLADDVASDKLSACHQVEKVEVEWISEDVQDAETLTDRCSKDASLDEEKWQAQYVQDVITADVINFPVIDLWEWELVVETVKKRLQVTRLFGRLVRPSSKLHPSVPSEGGCFKTASIRDVHLDLEKYTG